MKTRFEVDLRGEVLTAPTEEMWEAMREASLGWVIRQEDSSVNALEEECASLTQQAASLFVPTTSMANLLAMMSTCEPGDQVIMEARSHLFWVEQRNVSSIAQAAPRLIQGDRFGRLPIDKVERALLDIGYGYRPQTALVAVENTHNISGGTCLEPTYLTELSELVRAQGAKLFCDGARLFNSAVAQGVEVSELTADLDAISFSLNKGLGVPYGAILCASSEIVARARFHLRSLGGHSVHRAGMFAAAALVALKNEIPQLTKDHMSARALADALSPLDGIEIDAETVQTNIVRVNIDQVTGHSAEEVVNGLNTKGIGAGVLEYDALKFVTHREFDPDAIPLVVSAVESVLR